MVGVPGLGDVDLGAVLPDLLADVVLEQPPDEERRGQDGHPQGDASGGHQRDHRPDSRLGERGPASRAGAGPRGPVVEGDRPVPPRPGWSRALAGDDHDVARAGPGRPPSRWPGPGPARPPASAASAIPARICVDDGQRDPPTGGCPRSGRPRPTTAVATAPISGRLPRSRSPPHPNTQTTRPAPARSAGRGEGAPPARPGCGRSRPAPRTGSPAPDHLHPAGHGGGRGQTVGHHVVVDPEGGRPPWPPPGRCRR